jgi:SAM-dependent methyltransferase
MFSKHSDKQLADSYNSEFYANQVPGSVRSAIRYRDILLSQFRPRSIVDVGCGRGTWLKAFKDTGLDRLVGYDGPWNNQESMIDNAIQFFCADLNNLSTIQASERFDLAISLEVAEHIKPESAVSFISLLTQLSDVVLFSAAYIKQGGTNHINEQKHTYWAKLFASFDYIPYDLFRPVVWGDDEIEFWYQQNTFLYVRRNTPLVDGLAKSGHNPIVNLSFMDCVHPMLYEKALEKLRKNNRRQNNKVILAIKRLLTT